MCLCAWPLVGVVWEGGIYEWHKCALEALSALDV